MQLVVHERDARDARILEVRGEIDVATAPELSTRLNVAVKSGTGGVVVDLGGVDFIDSTGIAVLLNALRRLTRAKRPLALVCPPGPVLRALRTARLDTTFVVRPSRREALAAVSAAASHSAAA